LLRNIYQYKIKRSYLSQHMYTLEYLVSCKISYRQTFVRNNTNY